MSKLIASLLAGAMLFAAPAGAAILGPHAADCAAGSGKPAMLVKVVGLKSRGGVVRVQSYGGDPARYFEKGAYLERVEVAPPTAGPVEICMAVPRAGTYALSVRHLVNGVGNSGIGDGGGFSGNPNISFMDAILKRKPSPAQVAVTVRGLTIVSVAMNYVEGTSVRSADAGK